MFIEIQISLMKVGEERQSLFSVTKAFFRQSITLRRILETGDGIGSTNVKYLALVQTECPPNDFVQHVTEKLRWVRSELGDKAGAISFRQRRPTGETHGRLFSVTEVMEVPLAA